MARITDLERKKIVFCDEILILFFSNGCNGIDGGEHPLDDARVFVTVGFWDENENKWIYAGWCWSHDHFTTGQDGEVLAWRRL